VRQQHRVARDVPNSSPREEQVGQFLERRPANGDDLELRPVELGAVACFDQQTAVDAVEIEP
jgi:hypothetical protein